MANYSMVHDRISKGRGKAAQRVGQVFNVWHLDDHGFERLSDRHNCLLRRIHSGSHVEQRFFVSQIFELICDVRGMTVGDYLEERSDMEHAQLRYPIDVTDSDTDISTLSTNEQFWAPIYYLTQMRPVHRFIGVRMELLCQVRRGLFPDTDGVDSVLDYQDQGENRENVLILPNYSGTYEYRDVRTATSHTNKPALIPFQMEPVSTRGRPDFDLPMDWNTNQWFFACPIWPGLRLRENDYIIHPDGNRFRILSIFESRIGAVLAQGLLEKLES